VVNLLIENVSLY